MSNFIVRQQQCPARRLLLPLGWLGHIALYHALPLNCPCFDPRHLPSVIAQRCVNQEADRYHEESAHQEHEILHSASWSFFGRLTRNESDELAFDALSGHCRAWHQDSRRQGKPAVLVSGRKQTVPLTDICRIRMAPRSRNDQVVLRVQDDHQYPHVVAFSPKPSAPDTLAAPNETDTVICKISISIHPFCAAQVAGLLREIINLVRADRAVLRVPSSAASQPAAVAGAHRARRQ